MFKEYDEMVKAYNNVPGHTQEEREKELDLFKSDIRAVMDTPQGQRFMLEILESMLWWDDVFVTNSSIYARSILKDTGRRYVQMLDDIDPMYMVNINKERKIRNSIGRKKDE